MTFIANDWHAGLVPVYVAAKYRRHGVYREARCVLALHNLAHQVCVEGGCGCWCWGGGGVTMNQSRKETVALQGETAAAYASYCGWGELQATGPGGRGGEGVDGAAKGWS